MRACIQLHFNLQFQKQQPFYTQRKLIRICFTHNLMHTFNAIFNKHSNTLLNYFYMSLDTHTHTHTFASVLFWCMLWLGLFYSGPYFIRINTSLDVFAQRKLFRICLFQPRNVFKLNWAICQECSKRFNFLDKGTNQVLAGLCKRVVSAWPLWTMYVTSFSSISYCSNSELVSKINLGWWH